MVKKKTKKKKEIINQEENEDVAKEIEKKKELTNQPVQKEEIKVSKGLTDEECKKVYNPLKMWGSWVGVTIPLLIVTFFPLQIGLPITYWWTDGGGIFSLTLWSEILLCFLAGWGIHSQIRKNRK